MRYMRIFFFVQENWSRRLKLENAFREQNTVLSIRRLCFRIRLKNQETAACLKLLLCRIIFLCITMRIQVRKITAGLETVRLFILPAVRMKVPVLSVRRKFLKAVMRISGLLLCMTPDVLEMRCIMRRRRKLFCSRLFLPGLRRT